MRVTVLFFLVGLLAAAGQGTVQTGPRARVVESIVPWLSNNSACWSAVELRNLGNREVEAEVEAHKSSGALIPLVGRSGIQVRLAAGQHEEYRLQLAEDTVDAWVLVRERIPEARLSPVLAVHGATECLDANELHSTLREVAWPIRNPWFSGDVAEHDDGVLALINTSERPARVSGCYSFGVLYSVPRNDKPSELTPVCSETIDELVPPFGTRRFPLARGRSLHLKLTAIGDAIVLQMLRPEGTNVRVYKVDSTIVFGKELPDR